MLGSDSGNPSDSTMTGQALYLAWDARRATRGGSAATARRQQARLTALVHLARSRSRFCAERYRGLPPGVVDLRQLPPMTKGEVMARFDEWVTDPAVTRQGVEAFAADRSRVGELYLGRYLVWHSSGTSGIPALFVHDQRAMAVSTALDLARALPLWLTARDLWAILRRRGRTAALIVAAGHYASPVKLGYRRRTRPWRRGAVCVLSVLSPLSELVRQLNDFQPAIVAGYPTALMALATEQEAGRLRIRPVLAFSTSEPLSPAMRDRIEAALGCPMRETYAASEALGIAFGCAHGWLHVNTDWMILEPVDEEYRPIPPGHRSSTVLLTNLANEVQPIIRYDLGDGVLVSPTPCPCGNPLPAIHVDGRSDDIVTFTTPDGRAISLVPLALATPVYEAHGVHRYQVIQTAPDRLSVRLDIAALHEADRVWADVHRRLRAYLAEQGLQSVSVERAAEAPAIDPGAGKLRHVVCQLTPGNSGTLAR